jgi:hypothetical protein
VDALLSEALAPYQRMVEQLREKQREREAEVLVLKYAMVEMDRKVKEAERKQPVASTTSRAGGIKQAGNAANGPSGVSRTRPAGVSALKT